MNIKTQPSTLKNELGEVAIIQRAKFACHLAKQLEKAGEYESAYEALKEFWPDRNKPPNIGSLDESIRAELLLRAGALAGWLGSSDQTEDQETAKNFITQSAEIFEKLGRVISLAETRGELAVCYWRDGSYDEARIHLEAALNLVGDQDAEVKAVLLIRAAIVEVDAQRFDQALRLYNDTIAVLEQTDDHALKGTFHNGYGLLLRRLATPEDREPYLDRALIEYAAASYHFERARKDRYQARVENNLGYLYLTISQYKDAHTHLDRARQLFQRLKDIGAVAQ